MTSSTGPITITTIAAVTGELPEAGESCVIHFGEQTGRALLTEVSMLRIGSPPVEAPPHWSNLASIRIEVSGEATNRQLLDGRVQHFELRKRTDGIPFAAGLAIGHDSNRTSASANGLTIWLTGLSGAGKSTLAQELERRLQDHCKVECLDADIVRTHLCKGLGFTAEDRIENVRRLALTARIIAETGTMVLVSAISPHRAAREEARLQADGFIEVYVNAPLSVCESRDVKGLYKKARRGEIKSFTGIDDPYEPPLFPEIECRTNMETVEQSVTKILSAISQRNSNLDDSNPGRSVTSAALATKFDAVR